MALYIITATAVAIAAFTLGWFMGLRKSTQAHGWDLPKIDHKSESDRQSSN
jgi:hypothetical protein